MSFLFGNSTTTNSSNTPTLTGQGQPLFDQLSSFGSNVLNDPSAGLQPIKNAATEQINNSYGNIPKTISTQMARRGYGSSGSMGDTMYQTQLSRLGSVSNLNGQMAQLASSRQLSVADLMDNLLHTQVGSTGTSKTTTMDPSALFSSLGAMLMMGGGFGGGVSAGSSGSQLSNLAGVDTDIWNSDLWPTGSGG